MILNAFDVAMIVVLVAITIKVTLSGFVAEFFSKAAVLLAAACAVLFYGRFAVYVERLAGPSGYPGIISFLLIFLVVYLLVKGLQKVVGTAFEGESMNNLDRALGFFLGIAEGLTLIAVILIAANVQPWFDLSGVLGESLVARVMAPLVSGTPGVISGIVPDMR
ncbi:MAG TPA: CvpA family protein [Treponemataceae bacterium]|nr:CvpA family protein [Treponemataceae bacterium]